MRNILRVLLPASAFAALCCGQSTQGFIAGSVYNLSDGSPIPGATIRYELKPLSGSGTAINGSRTTSDREGRFVLPMLSPGMYVIRVEQEAYQPQEVHELELNVASALEMDIGLRRWTELWDPARTYSPTGTALVHYYARDVEGLVPAAVRVRPALQSTLQSAISYVIDPTLVRNLPFAGRDVYGALVLLPGVTASTGTGRGLGLAVNGQRPSSGNYLLDGLENNNALVSGPLTAIAPEAVQEYRISTQNYSAEYGRTAGLVANAVTRSGESRFHGIGYFYAKDTSLNANSFQNNRQDVPVPRRPVSEQQTGFQAGGPLVRSGLFWSSALEWLRSRSSEPSTDLTFPTTLFAEQSSTVARSLLTRFPAPGLLTNSGVRTETVSMAAPVSVDRILALQRLDYRSGPNQYMGRFSLSRVSRPDFVWTPYPDFVSGLTDSAISVVASVQTALTPTFFNVARAGFGRNRLWWDREQPEIPGFAVPGLVTPGSPAFYAYRNAVNSWEIQDNMMWIRGRHIVTFGGGILPRSVSGYLTTGRDGVYWFRSQDAFRTDTPYGLQAGVERKTVATPDYDRQYRALSWFGFVQDTMRLSSRLTLNLGLRYEYGGAPRNVGDVLDRTVTVRPGMTVQERSALTFQTDVRQLYRNDPTNWAPRAGLSYDLFGGGSTILRANYGLFYDRPFDNLWQTIRNNSLETPLFTFTRPPASYGAPVSEVLGALRPASVSDYPLPSMFDPGFHNARVQSYSYGIQQRLTASWALEVTGSGALGGGLVTTDIINRPAANRVRLNPDIPYDVLYRAPQGHSSYQALAALARMRSRHGSLQMSYTWSHSIDNQSEPLGFDGFNLLITSLGPSGPDQVASFSRQFDSRSDRGNSDFDQRHNLVFFSVWDVPAPSTPGLGSALLRDWRFAQLAAIRSGSPYTVYGNPVFRSDVMVSRAGVVDPSLVYADRAADGGRRLLNAEAFCLPGECPAGTNLLGRNALTGPGLWNLDISLSRSFPMPGLGESGRVTLRADAFNVLNHANLGNPATELELPDTFGTALYGRQDRQAAFPAVVPLNETPRQIQLMLRVEW